ncbi:MAG: hypothetical protein JXB50_11355 [Spirochaetes bacterium]|nr:hypothetical protein [Spirochaetota bacterium]
MITLIKIIDMMNNQPMVNVFLTCIIIDSIVVSLGIFKNDGLILPINKMLIKMNQIRLKEA